MVYAKPARPGWAKPAARTRLAAALLCLGACASPAPLERHEFRQPAMGTTFRLVIYAPDAERAEKAAEEAFARVRSLDERLSDYREDSELSRFGRSSDDVAPTPWTPLGEDLAAVLRTALVVAERSEGAFDPTVGNLSQLWRRARRRQELPREEDRERALARTGFRALEVDPDEDRARLLRRGMRLDLGGIAKGFAADEALAVLERAGLGRALVDAGGDLRLGAAPPGRPGWIVRVERGDSPAESILLSNTAIATSGDLYQFVEIDGVRYSHLLDPRSGWATTQRRSASVIAADGRTSDALASALCVLEPAEGLALVQALHARARVQWVDAEGVHELSSPDFPAPVPRGDPGLQSERPVSEASDRTGAVP